MKTLALRARVFIHCFLVFGYPGETLALVVHILHPKRIERYIRIDDTLRTRYAHVTPHVTFEFI